MSNPLDSALENGRRSVSPARIKSRFAVLLDWSAADKVILGALVMLVSVGSQDVTARYLLAHPDVAPYFDRAVLLGVPRVLGVLEAAFLAVAGMGVLARRTRPSAAYPVHALSLVYTATVLLAAHLLGLYTSLLSGFLVLGGITIGLVVFDRRPVFAGIASFLAGIVAMTAAEQAGLVRYAALMVTAPFVEGRLAPSWLVGAGGSSFVILCIQVGLVVFVIGRWRDRDAKLARVSEELAHAHDTISRYVASQLVEQVRQGDFTALGSHSRRRLTLFFSDIEGFSSVADDVEPEDLSEVLNEYLSEMTAIGERYGATIDKFVGDAIMIFFGAPTATTDRDHALRAVRMAVEMQRRMLELGDKWRSEGFRRPFRIRIGINTGQATVGSFGSSGRMDYTAIGRQVNLAARLQVHCEAGRILLSQSTWMLVRDDVPCVPKGEIQVKGLLRPVVVYEVDDAATAAAAGS